MTIESATTRLIEAFENNFICEQGPPKAFFELPQKDAKPVRGIYVVYAIHGESENEAELWFVLNVLQPLMKKAGVGPNGEQGYLYWRNEEKIDVSQLPVGYGDPKRFVIRTRLCVFDWRLNVIRIDDAVKAEGASTPTVEEW